MTLYYCKLRVFENRVHRRNLAENVENHAIRNIENITANRKILGNLKKVLW
jgi:hypothetical protein